MEEASRAGANDGMSKTGAPGERSDRVLSVVLEHVADCRAVLVAQVTDYLGPRGDLFRRLSTALAGRGVGVVAVTAEDGPVQGLEPGVVHAPGSSALVVPLLAALRNRTVLWLDQDFEVSFEDVREQSEFADALAIEVGHDPAVALWSGRPWSAELEARAAELRPALLCASTDERRERAMSWGVGEPLLVSDDAPSMQRLCDAIEDVLSLDPLPKPAVFDSTKSSNHRMRILFLAPNPFRASNREGYLQRVAAIDSRFHDAEKLYRDDLASPVELAKAAAEADMIYVHSIYEAAEFRWVYLEFGQKIVTDLHGVVPEEELYKGNLEVAARMGIVEREVFRYGRAFVAVTAAMVRHFSEKYVDRADAEWIVLPIFTVAQISPTKAPSARNRVVYAGGAQAWQGLEDMAHAVRQVGSDYEFTFLTHETEEFARVLGAQAGSVTIRSVPPAKVPGFYRDAAFGFILRDDSVVNRVACPTKLIEYLAAGVIPIVRTSAIGDFEEMGFQAVTFDEFLAGSPGEHVMKEMRVANAKVVDRLRALEQSGVDELRAVAARLAEAGAPCTGVEDQRVGAALRLRYAQKQDETVELLGRIVRYRLSEIARLQRHDEGGVPHLEARLREVEREHAALRESAFGRMHSFYHSRLRRIHPLVGRIKGLLARLDRRR